MGIFEMFFGHILEANNDSTMIVNVNDSNSNNNFNFGL